MSKRPVKCNASQLFGMWAIVPDVFARMVEQAKSVDLVALNESNVQPSVDDELFSRVGSMAVIDVEGPITKHSHSFQSLLGGAASVVKRRAIREAVNDDSIESIVLRIDSPGGTVAGTADFAADVASADARKPVFAYIEDLGASGAYWVASQARRVFANSTAIVGSIGTISVLHDESKRFEQEGVTVHVISTGTFKGKGVPGTEITEEQLDDEQRLVNEINAEFLNAVQHGRGMSTQEVKAVADARVFVGEIARSKGLVDTVATWDQAIQEMTAMSKPIETFATEHPEAVQAWKKEGHGEGVTSGTEVGVLQGVNQERERFAALRTEFPTRASFVCDQFAKGNDVPTAKAAYAAVVEGELVDERKKTAKLQAEIDTLSDGDYGVGHHQGSKKKEIDRMELSAEDRAKHDWACDFEGCKAAYCDNYDGYLAFVVEEQRHIDRDKK